MKKLFLIVFLCFIYIIQAQDTLYLSHNKLLELTLNHNLQIQKNELNYRLAKISFYKSIGHNLPDLGIGIKRYELDGFTQSTEGDFVDVNKNNEWNGKSFRISLDLSNLLFNSIAENKDVKAAFYNKEILNLDEQITVFSNYYRLVASKEKEKAITSFVSKNKEIVSQLQLQVSAGLRLQSELLLAQSNLNNLEIKLLQQKQNTDKLSQFLLESLNLNDNYILKIEYDFYKSISTDINNVHFEDKLNNRFELQQVQLEVTSNKWRKNKELFGLFLPEISFGMNDGLFSSINQDAFGNQNITTTSLLWNIPLGSIFPAGNYKNKNYLYKIKLLEKEQLENKLKAEMKNLLTAYNSALKQYSLAKESIEYTKLAYEQSLQRQTLRTATQLELFHAEKEFLNAKLIYIDVITYKQEIAHEKMIAFSKKVMQ